jgi:DNA (cytosine-5)-methyltransferase 1
MKHLGLFEGIGGFSLAARWMGWETVAWCEWNEFGQKVLRHHFPEAEGFGDITKTDFTKYEGKIDIITGGFPCQPFSLAGKRKGADDERYLWHEMLRAIQEVKPKFVIAENVFGITNIDGGLVFEQVCLDLENEGYKVQPFVLPAVAKNAPHRRDRVWFVAYRKHNGQWNSINTRNEIKVYAKQGTKRLNCRAECIEPIKTNGLRRDATDTDCNGCDKRNSNDEINTSQRGEYAQCDINKSNVNGNAANTNSIRGREIIGKRKRKPNVNDKNSEATIWHNFPTQSPICNGDDGISDRLVGITFPKWRNESIKAMGNAIVPQIAFELFRALHEMQSKPDFWVN